MADGIGGLGHMPQFSVLIGPMAEWIVYDNPAEGEHVRNTFALVVKDILMSEPGKSYDDLAWWWTELATLYLERN